jgi:hypothetical protein
MAADGVRVQTCVTSPPYLGRGGRARIRLRSAAPEIPAQKIDIRRLPSGSVRNVGGDPDPIVVQQHVDRAMDARPRAMPVYSSILS